MKILLAIALILVSGLSYARTDCRVVEHPDHFEVVCIGDEKASPAPDAPSAAGFPRGRPLPQQAAPEQMRVSAQPVTVPPTPTQTSAAAPLQTYQSQVSQGAVIHRQGRQQYQKGMEEARAARLQMISDLQQGQQSP